jgi:hypothetical protein
LRITYFLATILLVFTLLSQQAEQHPTFRVSSQLAEQHPTILVAQSSIEKPYLEKLFGNLGGANRATGQSGSMGAGEWLLAIGGTLFYGQIALLILLWVFYTASPVGIVFGLMTLAVILAFVLPRRPRPIALFVLACLNFMLALTITFTVAFSEGVPWIIISLVPVGFLVWLTLNNAFLKRKS